MLGAAFGLAMVVGATIGGGILGTPGSVATALPTTVLFMSAWIIGGLVSLMGATVYSELGAMIPRSGGIYVFARRAFGDRIGFFLGYADWINWSLSSTALILLVGQYVADAVPMLHGHNLLAGCLTFAALCAAQLAGVRTSGRIQEVTAVLKTVSLLALVAAVFLLPHDAGAPAAAAAPAIVPSGTALIVAFAVAMQGVIFSYDSYYAVVYCGEEIVDPGRDIPRSIFRGLFIVIAIYLVINAAFLTVVPVQRMAGDAFVGGTVARAIFGARGDLVIRALMIVSIIGTANAQIIATPRVLVAMARDGLFPEAALRINAGGTPTAALIISMALTGAALLLGSFDYVLGIVSFFIVTGYIITFAALFMLRRREPDATRPYRAWGYPLVPGLALAFMVLILIAMAAGQVGAALIAAGVMAVSWPASYVVKRVIGRAHHDGARG